MAAEDVPADMQRLLCAGKLLEDERTLASYGIQGQQTVDLVLKLRAD